MNHLGPRNRDSSAPAGEGSAASVPVALPMVVMTVHPDSTMTVTIDGAPHRPQPFGPPWRRDSFAAILDDLTRARNCPVRVEVRETDGSVFTDIITPAVTQDRTPQPGLARVAEIMGATNRSRAPTTEQNRVLTVCGAGFIPGEDVAVAVVTGNCDAAPDGTARSLLDAKVLPEGTSGEVILFGRISGTLTIGLPE